MSRSKRFADTLTAKFLASSLTFLFVLALAEIGLRIAWANPYAEEAPDQVIKLRIQHPRTNSWIRGAYISDPDARAIFRTNSRSYIEPAFGHDNPDLTLVFFGGSTTSCNAVQEELRFPALVGTLLTERGIATNSLNAGRSSSTLHDSFNVLINHVVNDEPDIAIVMHATNDIGILSRPRGYEVRSGAPVKLAQFPRWGLQMLSSRLSIFGLARRASTYQPRVLSTDDMHRRVVLKNRPLDSIEFERRLRAFVRTLEAFDTIPVLMTQPLSNSANSLTPEWTDWTNQDRFNDVIRRVAMEEDVLLIDLVQHLHDNIAGWDEPMKVFYDGMHVTDTGSTIYARHIADRLLPLVRDVAARRANADTDVARP